MKILQQKKYIILIILICIFLRLLLFILYKPWNEQVVTTDVLIYDAQDFHNLSKEIINNHRFYNISNDMIETLRTPGYPLFLSIIYKIFGYKPWIVLLFHIFIESLSCFFLYLAIKKLFNLKVALYSAFFYAINPFIILYTMTLITEILFMFFIILSFYFFTFVIKDEKRKKIVINLIISSFFIAIAALIRPIAQYFPIIILLFILFYFRKKIKIAIIYASTYIFMFLLVISPWIIRNYHHFKVVSLSSSGNYNLLELYATPLIAQKYNIDKSEAKDSLYNEVNILIEKEGLGEKLNQFQISTFYKKVALNKIKENPILFSKMFLMGLVHTYSSIGVQRYSMMLNLSKPDHFDIKEYSNIWDLFKGFLNKWGKSSIPIVSFTIPYLLIIYLSAIIGFFVVFNKNYNKKFITLILILSLYFVIIVGPAGLLRFKLPAIPFYLPFSSIGFIFIVDKLSKIKEKKHG